MSRLLTGPRFVREGIVAGTVDEARIDADIARDTIDDSNTHLTSNS